MQYVQTVTVARVHVTGVVGILWIRCGIVFCFAGSCWCSTFRFQLTRSGSWDQRMDSSEVGARGEMLPRQGVHSSVQKKKKRTGR